MVAVEPYVTPTQIRMPSGVLVDLLEIDREPILLSDIATSIAAQTRFLGHAPLKPTVAEHSLAVEYIARRLMPDIYGYDWTTPTPVGGQLELARAALMHDAAEAFVSDMPTPAKRALRALSPRAASTFDELSDAIQAAIDARFNSAPGEWDGLIHTADNLAYQYESSWAGWGGEAPPEWVRCDPYIKRCYRHSDGGEAMFLRRAAKLGIK